MSKPKAGGAGLDLEEGSYVMVAKSIWDIGTQTVKAFGKDGEESDEEKEAAQIVVEVEVVDITTKDKPALMAAWLTNNAGSDRSNLHKLMKACGIKNPADTDLDDILGKAFIGTIAHTASGKPKIKSYAGLTKGQKVGKTFAPTQSCYLDESFDAEAFEAMPKFFQDKAVVSKEYEIVEARKKKGKGKK